MTAFTSIPINGDLLLVDLNPENDRKWADIPLELLRLAAGLPATGPLDIAALERSIQACSGGQIEDCPSCQALTEVIDAVVTDREKYEGHDVEPLERW